MGGVITVTKFVEGQKTVAIMSYIFHLNVLAKG
jgi:hypothetical protein